MSDVNLSISKELVTPIIQSKINAVIIEAMGGSESLIETVVKNILNTKVDSNGKPSNYSGNKTYLEFAITSKIEEAIKASIMSHMGLASSNIEKAVMKELQSKSGSTKMAKLMMSAMGESLQSQYRSTVKLEFTETNDY